MAEAPAAAEEPAAESPAAEGTASEENPQQTATTPAQEETAAGRYMHREFHIAEMVSHLY